MSTPRRPLGEQALYVIREAADRCQEVSREALRAKVEAASVRPTPGTNHQLSENRPLADQDHEYHGVDRQGKPGKIKVYDLVGVAPVLWCRKGAENRKLPKGKEG